MDIRKKKLEQYLKEKEEKGERPGRKILEKYLKPLTSEVMVHDERVFIETFSNRYQGGTILVLATGPSLKDVPYDILSSNITIGCNGIGEYFYPDYYIICDPFVYGLHKEIFEKSPKCKILSSFTRGNCDIPIYYKYENLIGLSKDEVFSGDNTGYIMLSVAYIMGAKNIYLIGFDGYSSDKNFHFYEEAQVEKERVEFEWNNTKSQEIQLFREAMNFARKKMESEQCVLKLVGDSSYLGDILPKISLEEFVYVMEK